LSLGHRASSLDELGGFRIGDWQEHPVLGVFAVCPIDRLCEDRDEALGAAATSEDHDVKVRLIDQVSLTSKRATSLPGGIRGSWPAMLAAEVRACFFAIDHVRLRPGRMPAKRLPNKAFKALGNSGKIASLSKNPVF
jgi:hypothetical protein